MWLINVVLCFLPDKALKDTLERVMQSGYFDTAQNHQNGVCAEEEEEQVTTAVESSEAEEQAGDTG